jgi:transposase-like protein
MADMGSPDGTGPEGDSVRAGGPRAGRPRRRFFTSAYKLRILSEYEALSEHGARCALLRREGLYDSHIRKWRLARDRGALDATTTGPDATQDRTASQNRRLNAENARLTAELAKTRAAMEILGKTYALLEMLSESAD